MGSDRFCFRQFAVRHDRCAMKVGTDGVLLGAWARAGHPVRRALDIGTGTGLVALMLAQRFPDALFDAIDIDPDACLQARENVACSPFAGRISVVETPLQEFFPPCSYDLVVSNPPYFVESQESPDRARSLARHTATLSFADLLRGAARLLADQGTFALIVPTGHAASILSEASLQGLFPVRRLDLRTTPRRPPKRTLLALVRHRPPLVVHDEECLENADGTRSDWYSALCADFYL